MRSGDICEMRAFIATFMQHFINISHIYRNQFLLIDDMWAIYGSKHSSHAEIVGIENGITNMTKVKY